MLYEYTFSRESIEKESQSIWRGPATVIVSGLTWCHWVTGKT